MSVGFFRTLRTQGYSVGPTMVGGFFIFCVFSADVAFVGWKLANYDNLWPFGGIYQENPTHA